MESSSSSAKKSKLDEDARTYCDILARCSLPDVAKWKDEDLERAFRWSSYFKQVRKFCNVSIFFYHVLGIIIYNESFRYTAGACTVHR